MIKLLLSIVLLSTTFLTSEGGVTVSLIAPRSEVVVAGDSSLITIPTATSSPLIRPLVPQGRSIASRPTIVQMYYVYDASPSVVAQRYDVNVKKALENRLYFASIPHEDLVLKLEETRDENGLPRHLLESIRPFHPFYVDY